MFFIKKNDNPRMGFEGRLFVTFVDAVGFEEWKDQGM